MPEKEKDVRDGFFVRIKQIVALEKFKVAKARKINFYYKAFLTFFFLFIRFYFDEIVKSDLLVLFAVNIILSYVILNFLTNLIRIFIISTYRKRNKLAREHFDNFIIGINSVSFILESVIIFVGFLYFLRVDFKWFLTVFGVFFAGLSWVFKDHIVNVVNGIIIMFSKNFRIGDYIKMSRYKGIIKNITFLHTEIYTDEGDVTYVPNTIIFSEGIINYSKVRTKRIIFDFDVSIDNFNRIEKLEDYLITKIETEFDELISTKSTVLKVNYIYSDRVNLIIEIPVLKYNFFIEERVKKFTSLRIMDFLNQRKSFAKKKKN